LFNFTSNNSKNNAKTAFKPKPTVVPISNNKKDNNLFEDNIDKSLETNTSTIKTETKNKATITTNENKKPLPKNNTNLFADTKESPKDPFRTEPVLNNSAKQTAPVNKQIKSKPPVVQNKNKNVS
jgi:hypothetical protein